MTKMDPDLSVIIILEMNRQKWMNDYPCMERPVQMATIKTLEHCPKHYCRLWKGICTQGTTAF